MEKVLDKNVEDIRGQEHRRHGTLTNILELEPDLASYWIFGFVRNPWARMVSWWSMIDVARQAADAGHPGHIARFEGYPVWRIVRDYDFATFVTRGADEVERIRMPQIEFLSTPDRRPDYIGRTENMQEDINVVRKKLGLQPRKSLPHRHKGTHGPYRDYYTPATRDRVATLFRADIEEFGYEF